MLMIIFEILENLYINIEIFKWILGVYGKLKGKRVL